MVSPCHLHDRIQDAQSHAASCAALADFKRGHDNQAPPFFSTRLLVSRKTTESTPAGNSKAREEHSRNEAQDHWERLVLTELGDTSKRVTNLTQSRHLNLHIRQSVAGAAAGTLCKYLQPWTSWSQWALEYGIHPGQPTQAGMADYLHEVMTGAWQDRSCSHLEFKSSSAVKHRLSHCLQSLDTPLIAGFLAGAAIPRHRREALPLPLAVLVQWKRWICSGSAQNTKSFSLAAFCSWHGQASASQTRSAHVPLHCFQTHTSHRESAGEPKSPDLASHLVLLPLVFLDDFQAGVGATCTSMRFAIGTPRWWTWGPESGQRQSYPTHGPPQQVCSGGRKPNAFQQSNDVSPASPQRQHRCTTPGGRLSKPDSTRCTALKPPCSASQSRSMHQNTTGLSRDITANMADVHRFVCTVETTCGRRWHASILLFKEWQKVSVHSQHRGVERRSPWPSPQSRSTRSPSRWR